jgi:hypothetical protein
MLFTMLTQLRKPVHLLLMRASCASMMGLMDLILSCIFDAIEV